MTFRIAPTAALAAAASCAVGAGVSFAPGPWVWVVLFAALVLTVLAAPVSWAAVPWWMNPAWGLLLGVVPGVAIAAVASNEYFLSHWETPKLIEGRHLILTGTLLLAFSLGAGAASRLMRSPTPAGQLHASPNVVALLERWTRILFYVTMAGYLVLLTLGVLRGLSFATLTGTLAGSSETFYAAREDFLAPVAGLTTLTQFGPLVVTLLLLLRRLGSQVALGRYLVPLFLLAVLRAVLKGDRLGIIELLIPIVIIAVALPRRGPTSRRCRALAALFPLWIPVALLSFFGAFEYFRTWSHTYRFQYGENGFVSFVVDRLMGYYATAPNNSALILGQDTGSIPFWVIEWFWNLPGVSSIYPPETIPASVAFGNALAGQANVQFNNPGGILVPVADLGAAGATGFWLLAGIVLGTTFALFRRHSFTGLLLYPVLFVGLLEGGRVLYWSSGRAAPSIVAAVVLASVARGVDRQAPARRPAALPVLLPHASGLSPPPTPSQNSG